VGELVECERQKARNEELQDGGCCANFLLSLRSCRPVQETKLKYWFCEDCRDYYKDYEVNTLDAVLSYWAFKSDRGYSFGISPKLIPADLVFGGSGSVLEDPVRPRRELVALGEALPRKPFEASVDWLQRLEEARRTTLEIAEKWSQALARCQNWSVVGMQPRITTPMSVYPYSYLSSITELSDSQETTTSFPPSHGARGSPQVHPETLRQLCGKAPVALARCLTTATDPQQNTPQENVSGTQTPNQKFAGVTSRTPISRDFPSVHFNNAASDSEEPNMTSHFSVSEIDLGEMADLNGIDAVSPLSTAFTIDDAITAFQTSSVSHRAGQPRTSEDGKRVVVNSTAETVASQPHNFPSSSRAISEDEVSAAGGHSSEDSWDEVELGKSTAPSH
jgi:hypothetical protein